MGKEGNYSGGTKVYESKKEKKRRLVANNDVESEELVITPRVEIVQIGDAATSNVPRIVLEMGGGGEKRVMRTEVFNRKLCGEGNKEFFLEARSDGESGGIGVNQVNIEEIKSESADSAGNQTDVTGASSGSSMPLKFSCMITAGAKENFSQPKSDMKRSMEICDDKFSRKKPKADHIDYHIEKSGVDKTSTFVEQTNVGIASNMNDVQVSKVPVSCTKERDGEVLSEIKLQPSQGTSTKSEPVRGPGGPGQRNHRNVKDAKFPDIGIKDGEDGRRSHDIYIRAQDKSSVRILDSRKKVAVSGYSILPFEKQESTRILRSTVANKFNTSKHRLKRQVGEKLVYNMKHRKSDGKISSEGPSKSSFSKINQKVISPKEGSKNAKLLHNKLGLAVKNEKSKESDASRGTIKRKLREQIKNILLDAGWKIEFRPRLNRNYEDSIYVSPHGGAGYWSIVKAYDVYVSEFHKRNSNSEEAISTFAVIPPELLLLLKRNIINRRRTKKEMEEVKRLKEMEDTKHKVGIGKRKKKAKESTKIKFRRNKGTGDDVRETIAMKRKLIVGNSKRRGCALLVRGSNKGEGSEKGDFAPYVWKRTILSWMIDLGLLTAYGKVRYMNMRRSRALLDGRITRDGIQCSCCSKIFSVSKFEIHAGSKLHQPYENLCLEVSGISLLQCQINAWKKQESKQCILDTDGDDPNDDTCGICGDGGDLICCDSCPSTFHLGCLGIDMLPTGDWHCTNCSCKFCGTVHGTATQYGTASSSLFTCSQCAQKYHKDCVPEGDAVPNVSNSSSNLFCGRSCRKVFRKLQKFIGVRNKLDTGFYWSIVRRFDDPSTPLSTMAQRVESNSKIALAYAVMDECFVPIIDQRSGVNLIHNVVYNCGANFNRLNFSGFYTFILERGDEIIAAASVRIHDTRLAEMPFIGTRSMYRRQGMCRRLLKGIESALRTLCINKLIIPAISELTETWTTVFGFKPLGISQKEELKSVNMLVFPDTGLLQKSLIKDSKKKRTNPEFEKKLETQISVKEDKNYSADEIIDSKESKCDAETIQSDPSVSKQTTNFLLEASGCHVQFCRSVEGAANVQSNDRKYVCSCCNPVQNDRGPRNCSKEMVAFIEESKKKVGDLMNAFSFQHPSEFLHTSSRIEASESRSPQNESNNELSVTDDDAQGFLQNLRSLSESEPRSPQNESIYRKEDENTLGFLQKLEDKLHINGVAHDVRLENCEPLDAGGGTAYDLNGLNLRQDDNGLESNVNEENVEVSVDIISHLSTSPGEGTCAYSELCGNGYGANPKLSCVASNESCSQEKSELPPAQLKYYLDANNPATLDLLAVSGYAKSLEVEDASGIVRTDFII